jgi:hypothetical protein
MPQIYKRYCGCIFERLPDRNNNPVDFIYLSNIRLCKECKVVEEPPDEFKVDYKLMPIETLKSEKKHND